MSNGLVPFGAEILVGTDHRVALDLERRISAEHCRRAENLYVLRLRRNADVHDDDARGRLGQVRGIAHARVCAVTDQLRVAIAAAIEQVMRTDEARAAPMPLEAARRRPFFEEHGTLQAGLGSIART